MLLAVAVNVTPWPVWMGLADVARETDQGGGVPDPPPPLPPPEDPPPPVPPEVPPLPLPLPPPPHPDAQSAPATGSTVTLVEPDALWPEVPLADKEMSSVWAVVTGGAVNDPTQVPVEVWVSDVLPPHAKPALTEATGPDVDAVRVSVAPSGMGSMPTEPETEMVGVEGGGGGGGRFPSQPAPQHQSTGSSPPVVVTPAV